MENGQPPRARTFNFDPDYFEKFEGAKDKERKAIVDKCHVRYNVRGK